MRIICRDQLKDLGFESNVPYLYKKVTDTGTSLFIDYRNDNKKIYAYSKDRVKMPTYLYKEFEIIEKIEKKMAGDLSLYE